MSPAPEVSTTPDEVPTPADAAWLLEQLGDDDASDRCPDCSARLVVLGPPSWETNTTPVRCTACPFEDY